MWYLLLWTTFIVAKADICGIQVEDVVITGYKMRNHLLSTYGATGLIKCAKRCLKLSNCLSINYDRVHINCELNSSNRTVDPSDLIQDKHSLYSDLSNWISKAVFKQRDESCGHCETRVTLSDSRSFCVKVAKTGSLYDRACG